MRAINLQTVASYPATTLAGLMRAIVELFATVEPTTPIYIGERYLKQEGAPRRIIMVPTDGTIAGVLGIGETAAASVVQTCAVYLWGAETGNDLDRYDDADALLARFVNALRRLAGSRVKDAPLTRERDTDVVTYGEEYRIDFAYEREIPTDQEVWNYAIPNPITSPLSPPPYDSPPGTPASTIAIDLSTVPQEPS